MSQQRALAPKLRTSAPDSHAIACGDENQTGISGLTRQTPAVIWFTGLSGAGKSTTAVALDQHLRALGHATFLLDGDRLRSGLCSDLDFSPEGRAENLRRAGELCQLMVEAGLIVLATFISPYRKEREQLRDKLKNYHFVECFINTPLAVCELRDTKGLYKQAREGQLKNLTGIDAPYETPTAPEIILDATSDSPVNNAAKVIAYLSQCEVL